MDNLKQLIAGDLQADPLIVKLGPSETGASSKKYYSVSGISDDDPDEMFILMQAPADTLSDYLEITRYFKRNHIRSPRIFYANLAHGYIILENCGKQTLELLVRNAPQSMIESMYEGAIDLLLALQTLPPDPANIVSKRLFDKEKFSFEFDFHVYKKLITNYFGHVLSNAEKYILQGFFETIVHELTKQPVVFTHRDFQASNLILKENELVIIDFQDARMGLALYDLVSLIEDVYVTLKTDMKNKFINHYKSAARAKHIPIPLDVNFSWIYDLTTLQRKLHDAGAFAFCFENFGNIKYLPYINSVFQHALDVMSRYTIFSEPYDLLTMISHANPPKK
ncbi:phosphotransferase [bacterium]|nr:MAG: phosphotransferase [bacterium]